MKIHILICGKRHDGRMRSEVYGAYRDFGKAIKDLEKLYNSKDAAYVYSVTVK